MKDKEFIKNNNVILECYSGSRLYKTNNENSDIDIVGVFIEPLQYLLSPFYSIDEFHEDVKSKKEDGKNDKDAIDKKYYSLQKFIKLTYENNPNIIELLYVTDDIIIKKDEDIFNMIIENRDLFINDRLIKTFYGYAVSQENRMYQNSDKYKCYRDLLNIINNYDDDMRLIQIPNILNQFKSKNTKYKTGEMDMCIELTEGFYLQLMITVKEAKRIIKSKIDQSSYRVNYILDKGYDYKFASHVVRLLDEAIDLITNKKISFPNENIKDVINIKNGLLDIEDIKNLISNRKEILKKIEQNHNLPPYGKHLKDVNDLTFKIYEQKYNLKLF